MTRSDLYKRRRFNIRGEEFGARFNKVSFNRKGVRGEEDDDDNATSENGEELFKLVVDTADVTGELLSDGVSRDIAEQLEVEIGDLLEAVGQSGSIEIVATSEEESSEDDNDESASGERSAKTSGKLKQKAKGEEAAKLEARIAFLNRKLNTIKKYR